MSFLRPNRDSSPVQASGGLHELAQQKVQAALAGLSQVETADADDTDPAVQQAVERMQAQLRELNATDRWGRPVTWAQLAHIVIGPLAGTLRDEADDPEKADDHEAERREERLLAALERRYPDPPRPDSTTAEHTLPGCGVADALTGSTTRWPSDRHPR